VTTRPRPVSIDRSLLPGLAAVALFALMAAVALSADFGAVVADFGFPAGESVVGAIGAALIGIDAAIPVENFVVALIVIAIALDAALDGSIMLAKRDEEGEEPATDGGRPDQGGEP
jgi:NADH-quinone oxidoreductase subunit J